MTESPANAGYFRCGLPYNRAGRGPRPLVIFQGLLFEHKPMSALVFRLFGGSYRFLEEHYTTYTVSRKPGLPAGYSMRDMASDYATMVQQEFGAAIDVIGVSTGGSVAQHFAADHPHLLRRLVLHSSAHTLSDAGKAVQLRVGHLARQRRWRAAYAALAGFVLPQDAVMNYVARPVAWLVAALGGTFGAPKDPSDLVVTIEAEDKHDFKERLAQITAPTLVIAGDQDPFYSETLFRETVAGIPNASLVLYERMRHPAYGKRFRRDVLAFLKEGMAEDR